MDIKIKKINSDKKIVIGKVEIKQDEKIDNEKLEELKQKVANYYDIDLLKVSISESEK